MGVSREHLAGRWLDLSRATGGRLRKFALALAPPSECEPDFSALALATITAAALAGSRLTVRVLA